MRLTGQQTDDAVRAWVTDEIKGGPAGIADLGKFFFSVSAGSIGFFATFAKLDPSYKVTNFFWAALALYVVSVLIAVYMVVPRAFTLSSDTELYAEYKKKIQRVQVTVYLWFGVWLVATLLAASAVFPHA